MKRNFIFDTNTLISALLKSDSTPRRAFDKAFYSGLLVFSNSTFSELREVLQRPKFHRYITQNEVDIFLNACSQVGQFVEPEIRVKDCRDPKDNKFLELAIASNAACIISGDEDLLVLNPYGSIISLDPEPNEDLRIRTDDEVVLNMEIPILTAADFLAWEI